ncbi:hypothetical protein NC652_012731 [Populus alba x Populus x berolinensis]|nr:hypothetical protein NC652_012731 [Populus alba x Populus x berolinensis]
MAEEDCELNEKRKREIAKWFLLNSPAGEIQYIAKDLRSVLNDEKAYNEAALEAFPLYNKSHFICLELPDRSGEVLVTSYNELDENEFLDPRTAQVAIVDHVKQVCTEMRPTADEELSSPYIEEFHILHILASPMLFCSLLVVPWMPKYSNMLQKLIQKVYVLSTVLKGRMWRGRDLILSL